MKKMHTHTLLHEGTRLVVLFFLVLIACNGFAQDQYARPITIDTNSLDVNSKCKRIKVYTFDNNPEIRWIVGTKNRPEGTVTDSSCYLLFPDAFLPTLDEKSGNMVYDGDTIPLDGVVFGNIKVANYSNRIRLKEVPKLNARLELHRTVFRFNEDSIRERFCEESILYKKYMDSVIGFKDQVFLCFDNEKDLRFALIVNDTTLVRRNDFDAKNKKIELNSSLVAQILKDKHEDLLKPKVYPAQVDSKFAVVARGRMYCFIKDYNIDVNEDRSAVPPMSKSSNRIPWLWIIIGLLALAVIITFFILIKTGKLGTGKNKKNAQRKFTFSLGAILKPSEYNDAIADLNEIAKKESINFEVDPNERIISFTIDKENVNLFRDENKNSFFAKLKEYIEKAKTSPKKHNIPSQDTEKLTQIEEAKETVAEIEKFVAQFAQQHENGEDQIAEDSQDNGNNENQPTDEQFSKKDREDAENWKSLRLAMGNNAPKNAKELINRIEDLNAEIALWKEKTKYDNPSKAENGINKLNDSINVLQEKKNNLEIQVGELNGTIKEIQNNPKSFKDEKGYDELTKLIKDAEKGSEVRDLMNNDPNEVDKNSATGILVRKGQIFDKYVEIDDSVFKDKDSESKIRKAIEKSKIAMQVRKGNFLDKAKDDVKLLNKDEENYLGECKLKEFIAFIVNPDKILETSDYTNTGLFKMVKDLDTFIKAKADKNEPVSIDGFTSNWLKERLTVLVAGYNDNLKVEHVASLLGKEGYNTESLKPNVKQVFDNASSYIGFGLYRNYWKNIVSPLFTALNELQNHDVVYNTRILMFYTSQFYSIANIMNEIFGDTSYSTKRPKLNVALFNGANAPVPDNRVGFPKLDDSSLNDCLFEYKGAEGEDAKVRFLKQYKPLPFILIYNYYSDNILS